MDGTIEPGDHVHHHPTGEDWVVRYVKGDRMSWLGWPPGEAMLSDCTLIRKADVRVDPPHPARWGLAATPTHQGANTMTDDLPPLPEPAYEAYYYTADQMHAYGDARAAAATERAAQVCDEHASIEGIAQKCAAAIRAGS